MVHICQPQFILQQSICIMHNDASNRHILFLFSFSKSNHSHSEFDFFFLFFRCNNNNEHDHQYQFDDRFDILFNI